MKTIRIADGLHLEIDGEGIDFIDKDGQPPEEWSWNRVWKFLHYDKTNASQEEYGRALLMYGGRLDLSPDFEGHHIVVSMIPPKN